MKLLYKRGRRFFISNKQTQYPHPDDGWIRMFYIGLNGNTFEESALDTEAKVNGGTLIEITDSQYEALLDGFLRIKKLMDLQRTTIQAIFESK